MKRQICNEIYMGERPLFGAKELSIKNTVFSEGESPLKESSDIELENSSFQWKYPLWYCNNIKADKCQWEVMARAGVWYSTNVSVNDCLIEAPKNFRRCSNVSLKNVFMSDAAETLWQCDGVNMENVTAKGDYFAMNSTDMHIENFTLSGNYCFDGAKNVCIKNARMMSKDAFWNSENITVYDSYISGEYLGWNAKNLTLINCTIESLQGMCYIENLIMKNCRLRNTTLAFEYSSVDVDIEGKINSIINPLKGIIRADAIDEIIIDRDKVDAAEIKIECKEHNE